MSTADNTWLLLLMPTIVMLATVPLWFIKAVPNFVISLITYLGYFGYILFIFIACMLDDGVSSPGFFGGLLISIVVLLMNAFQFLFMRRTLNNNRCDECGSLRLRVIGKNIDGVETTNTKYYINSVTKEQYEKTHRHIIKKTTYFTYCPDCDSLFEWTEEDEDDLRGDTRPEHLR